MIGAAVDRGATSQIPGSLFWAYQASLNRKTDLLFWQETHYKPNQRLNPSDPVDSKMIQRWWATRARVEQSRTPRDLIRSQAVEQVFAKHVRDPNPLLVYAAGPGGDSMKSFPGFSGKQVDEYVRARTGDSSYIAIFNAADSRWPQPTYETYPGGETREIEIDQPSPPTVSGNASAVIYHEGLVLRPLSPDEAAEQVVALERSLGRLLKIFRPGDVLYFWDGPWGVLSGSRGIAIVRHGVVVETFTTMVS
jgi:hypothetical protein